MANISIVKHTDWLESDPCTHTHDKERRVATDSGTVRKRRLLFPVKYEVTTREIDL